MGRREELIKHLQAQVKYWQGCAAKEREKREALEETLRDLKAAYRENPRD